MRAEAEAGSHPATQCADPRLDALVARVRGTARYAHIVEPVVRRIGARELAAHSTLREAVKATQRLLHQIGSAYLPGRIRYADWLARLQAAKAEGPDALRARCREMMRLHASTRERLPVLERIYVEALEDIAPIASVVDIACGLGPLAIPWMPLAPGARYLACDMYEDLIDFLREFLPLTGVEGSAEARDVVASPPSEGTDLALVQKFLPNVEQQAEGASLALLDALRCRHILVTFPSVSLGGTRKGMPTQYEAMLLKLVGSRDWQVRRYSYPEELAFWITKEPEDTGD